MKAVFDTNVIVDVLARRSDFYDLSYKALAICDGTVLQSCITSNTVTDIAYILHRYGQAKIVDFEDAILSECASRHNSDFIVTRNPKDYKNSVVPCIIPADFAQKFN